jgi:hypothetical protein
MIKKSFLSLAALVVILACCAFMGDSDAVLKLDGGPPYNTNAPSEKTCSGGEGTSACHSGGIPDNSGPGSPSITFSGGSVYVPGQTYTVTVTITHPVYDRFGFQIVSLQDNNNLFAGTVTVLDTTRNRSQQPTWGPGQDRVFVMHRIAGTSPVAPNTGQWAYRWQAPSTNVGNISFYACCLAGNNNGQNDSGDETYSTKITISPSAIGISQPAVPAFGLTVYPNPASDFIQLDFSLPEACTVQADLLDMSGRIVQTLVPRRPGSVSLSERVQIQNGLAAGLYLVRTRVDEKEYLKKVQLH